MYYVYTYTELGFERVQRKVHSWYRYERSGSALSVLELSNLEQERGETIRLAFVVNPVSSNTIEDRNGVK